LFNQFSNYGFIVRLKTLFSKPHMALIQYKDGIQAAQGLTFLKNVRIFGSTIDVNVSKFTTVSVGGAGQGDKVLECETSGLNRCGPAGMGSAGTGKSVSAPTEILHVSNLSAMTPEDTVTQFLSAVRPVIGIKTIASAQKHMMLVQFESVEAAIEVMCLLHNTTLDGNHIKLSFTRSKM
jgi:polypyrimidine tract-binding protein 2